ncbi:MAG: hypothetical protein KDD47_10345 [Acidobacteria bacterium]|nr:hypothetical protein [Acidobacteriota bacterium]
MSRFREVLPVEAHYVARVAAMLAEDCGPCTQLNLRMALEAGVEKGLLEALIHRPDELPEPLRALREYAFAVASGDSPTEEQAAVVRQAFGDGAPAELAVLIAGSRIYPTAKRALLQAQHCEILRLEL